MLPTGLHGVYKKLMVDRTAKSRCNPSSQVSVDIFNANSACLFVRWHCGKTKGLTLNIVVFMGNYKIILKLLVTVFSLAVFSKGREVHV
jgi:hypothetical protein